MDAIGFDVYGTLVDPQAMQQHLRALAGDRASELALAWRVKQVEYAFRRGLMGRFESFEACTADALAFAATSAGVELPPAEADRLLGHYRELPAYPDVRHGLSALRSSGRDLVAFSNGSAPVVRELLGHAGLLELLDDVVSVAEVGTFKPHPSVYQHLAKRLRRPAAEVWLVSGNAWDVIGAKAAGLRAAWLRRSPGAVYDPWGMEPDLVAGDLTELAARLTA